MRFALISSNSTSMQNLIHFQPVHCLSRSENTYHSPPYMGIFIHPKKWCRQTNLKKKTLKTHIEINDHPNYREYCILLYWYIIAHNTCINIYSRTPCDDTFLVDLREYNTSTFWFHLTSHSAHQPYTFYDNIPSPRLFCTRRMQFQINSLVPYKRSRFLWWCDYEQMVMNQLNKSIAYMIQFEKKYTCILIPCSWTHQLLYILYLNFYGNFKYEKPNVQFTDIPFGNIIRYF